MDKSVTVCDVLTEYNWFQCQHCDYKTMQRNNLRTHGKRHTDVCFQCKKTFPSTYDMKQHANVHTDRKGGT